MIAPIFITAHEIPRSGNEMKECILNAAMIQSITEAPNRNEAFLSDYPKVSLIDINHKTVICVAETPKQLSEAIYNTTKRFVIDTVQSLHNRGYIK